MTVGLFLAAVVAGGIGAGARYALDTVSHRLIGDRFPWGILVVNLTGAFALGILSGGVVDASGLWVLGVGLLGGYTTFSSVAVSTVALAEDGRPRASVAYALANLAGSVALAAAGLALGVALSP